MLSHLSHPRLPFSAPAGAVKDHSTLLPERLRRLLHSIAPFGAVKDLFKKTSCSSCSSWLKIRVFFVVKKSVPILTPSQNLFFTVFVRYVGIPFAFVRVLLFEL